MYEELIKLIFSMGLNEVCVVNVASPIFWFVGEGFNGLCFEMFHENVCNNWGKWGVHGHAMSLSIDITSETEVGRS